MRLKMLTALAITLFAASAIPGVTGAAFASDERPSYGECASPPPNSAQCDKQ